MYRLHEKCRKTTLSLDKRSGEKTEGLGFVFSDRPLEDGIIFTCKLSGLKWGIEAWEFLSVYLGVTTDNPASLPDHPHRGPVRKTSCLARGDGSLYKAGKHVGKSDDLILDLRDPTEVGVRMVDGELRLYQDGVYKGVAYKGLRGRVWAVVYTGWYQTVSVICNETTAIALENTPVPVTYKMDSRPRGYAVIVNMSKVRGQEDRLGSEHDVRRLTKLFRRLRFDVETLSNISAQDIYDELRGMSKRPAMKSQDAFVLVLMSHGGPGYILGADGERVDLEKTFWLFSNNGCPALRKKPKLFFIQSCNGDNVDNGDQADADAEAPKIAEIPAICDMLVAKASVKGYKSYRNEVIGSRFIQSLVDEFEEHAAVLDVTRMMTRVISRVHRKATNVTQCPVVKTTLTKDLYFNP